MEAPQDWSAEDRAWLQTVMPDFHSIAIKYGRTLFAMVMKAWTISNSLHGLLQGAQSNPEVRDHVGLIQASVNDLYEALLLANGHTGQDFSDCQQDIQRRAMLLQGAMGKFEFTAPANDQCN